MKNQKKIFVSCLVIMTLLSGCSTWRKLNGTEQGAVIGGGAGAVVGEMVAPGIGGAVVGGAVGAVGGGLIGHEEDRHHRRY